MYCAGVMVTMKDLGYLMEQNPVIYTFLISYTVASFLGILFDCQIPKVAIALLLRDMHSISFGLFYAFPVCISCITWTLLSFNSLELAVAI